LLYVEFILFVIIFYILTNSQKLINTVYYRE